MSTILIKLVLGEFHYFIDTEKLCATVEISGDRNAYYNIIQTETKRFKINQFDVLMHKNLVAPLKL